MSNPPEVLRSTQNTFCIEYWNKDTSPRVLRRINSNGVPVSTTKFSEVFFYNDIRHAMPHGRFLMDNGYSVKVRKCNLNVNDKFWLM